MQFFLQFFIKYFEKSLKSHLNKCLNLSYVRQSTTFTETQTLLQEANENCTKINVIIEHLSVIPDDIYYEILVMSTQLKEALAKAQTLNSGVVINEPVIS